MFLLEIIPVKKKGVFLFVGLFVSLFLWGFLDSSGLNCEFGKELRKHKIGNKDV